MDITSKVNYSPDIVLASLSSEMLDSRGAGGLEADGEKWSSFASQARRRGF